MLVVSESPIHLSEREREVLRHIALGYSNKEIAARLGIGVKSVETYKVRGAKKIRARSRVDIVAFALRERWLVPPPDSTDASRPEEPV